MIPQKDIDFIKKKLEESTRPLFYFDDDPDGVCSFIQMYKVKNEGKGVCVKGKPILEAKYAQKIDQFSPDKIFILDKPLIEQEFLDSVNQEVIWLDHHPVQNNKGVKYFNPRLENSQDGKPTSYWSYLITKDLVKNSLWIAMVGIIGDWHLLLADEFRKEYPGMLPKEVDTPEKAIYESEIGKLVKIFDFNLKGTTSEVMKSIKILTRIENPKEILEQTTPRGKFIYKKFQAINKEYEKLLQSVEVTNDPILLFKYTDNKLAISSQLSNELLYKYPDKIIFVIREKSEDLMISLRSSKIDINLILNQALTVTKTGSGGGHTNACGASMQNKEFDVFLEKFRELLKKVL